MELRRPPVRPNLRWIWPCPECFTIANAVYDAIGIRFTRLPITPENVLEALTLPLSPRRLCRNQREPTSASTRNRRSGDEALERKPFIAQRWGVKPMKRNPFPTRPITHNFKRPHSKAEEPDCLFRWNPLSIMITTQSPRGRGRG